MGNTPTNNSGEIITQGAGSTGEIQQKALTTVGDLKNVLTLGTDEATVATILENKKHPIFNSTLGRGLESTFPNNHIKQQAIAALSREVKETEVDAHIKDISNRERSLSQSVNSVKSYISDYYQMIYNYIETEKHKPLNEQSTMTENFFNREDPLFWVALFLYQRELNSTLRFVKKLVDDIAKDGASKMYSFLLENNNAKTFSKKLRTFLNSEDPLNKNIGAKYGTLTYQEVIEGKLLDKFIDNIEYKRKLIDLLRADLNKSNKIFEITKAIADKRNQNYEETTTTINNLKLISGKFNNPRLNPFLNFYFVITQLEQLVLFFKNKKTLSHSEAMEQFRTFKKEKGITITTYDNFSEQEYPNMSYIINQDINALNGKHDVGISFMLSNESEFRKTMTWFGQDKYEHAVKNINLAAANVGLPRTYTLKGKIDKICGTIKNSVIVNPAFVKPSWAAEQQVLLPTSTTQDIEFPIDQPVDASISKATDDLFNDILGDEKL